MIEHIRTPLAARRLVAKAEEIRRKREGTWDSTTMVSEISPEDAALTPALVPCCSSRRKVGRSCSMRFSEEIHGDRFNHVQRQVPMYDISLSDTEREQAIALVGIRVNIMNGRAYWKVERHLLDVGEWLLTNGNPRPRSSRTKRNLFLGIADDCKAGAVS
jgi:hypothetical protein